jgi:hypothetical protein
MHLSWPHLFLNRAFCSLTTTNECQPAYSHTRGQTRPTDAFLGTRLNSRYLPVKIQFLTRDPPLLRSTRHRADEPLDDLHCGTQDPHRGGGLKKKISPREDHPHHAAKIQGKQACSLFHSSGRVDKVREHLDVENTRLIHGF